MNRTRISLTAALLSLCLLLSGCMMPPAEGTVTSFSLEDIPAWSGEPYVAVDGNQPDFPEEDMTLCPLRRTVSWTLWAAAA